MKKLFALSLVAVMLLAVGCQNEPLNNTDNTDPLVTNAQGEPEVTVSQDINTDDPESTQSDVNEETTDDTADDSAVNVEVAPPTLSSPVSGMTEMYLSYSTEYDTDGNLSTFTVYEYDEQGNKIRETTSTHKSNFTDTQTFEYNSNNLVVKAAVYTGDVLKEHIKIDYDDNGNITSYRTYNPNGSINYGKYISNFDAKYDSNGREVERIRYSSEDDYTVTTTEYNEAGLVTRDRSIKSNGKLLSLVTYEYDDKNRRTRWIGQNTENPEYDQDITTSYIDNPDGTYSATTTYTGTNTVIGFEVYDEHGNIIQLHTYLDDELYNMHFTTYNENGDITYTKTLNANNDIISETTNEYFENGELSHSYTVRYSGSNDEETEETTVIYSKAPESDGYYKKQSWVSTLNGEYYGETVQYFDKSGNIIRTTTKVVSTTDIEITYEYDIDGNLLETCHYSNGVLVYRLTNEYIKIEGALHSIFNMK